MEFLMSRKRMFLRPMNSRAQSAMEFMMTYGWALMIVFGFIGALVYFNLLNPSTLLPDSCNLGYRISCDDFIIQTQGSGITSTLSVTNSFSDNIVLANITLVPLSNADNFTCSNGTINLKGGQQAFITMPCSPAVYSPQAGGKNRFKTTIIYYFNDSGSSYNFTLYGEIFTKIEK